MPKYTFNLHSFVINHRRTNHLWGGGSDTVKIAVALQVGDFRYPSLYRNIGDLSDTGKEYVVDLAFRDIEIHDYNTPIKFSFVMANSGYGDEAKLADILKKGADYLAGLAVSSIPKTGFWGLVAAGASELAKYLVNELVPIIAADCDGLVASDVFAFRAGDLLTATEQQPWHSIRSYPGTDSPHGCGGNSDYTVGCSIEPTSRDVRFGGLWTTANDGFFLAYGDSYDAFTSYTLPQATADGLRPFQIWSTPTDGGRWGGLFRSGNDSWEIAYGDSYDAFNDRLSRNTDKGLLSTQIWVRQWGGSALFGGLFRGGTGGYAVVYGDSYDYFVNTQIPQQKSQGLQPVQ